MEGQVEKWVLYARRQVAHKAVGTQESGDSTRIDIRNYDDSCGRECCRFLQEWHRRIRIQLIKHITIKHQAEENESP